MFVVTSHEEDWVFYQYTLLQLKNDETKQWMKNILVVRHIFINGYCLNLISITGMV